MSSNYYYPVYWPQARITNRHDRMWLLLPDVLAKRTAIGRKQVSRTQNTNSLFSIIPSPH